MATPLQNPLLNSLNFQPQTAKQKEPHKPIEPETSDVEEYTEEDLESFIPSTTDASYFEKAQDFRTIIKVLRIKYLGLKPAQKQMSDGAIITVYRKDKTRVTGINVEGVEGNVRFLETRLGRHTILSNWSEERMFVILKDDMLAWLDMMEQNYEAWELTGAAMIELRILINDLLESTYRRPMENLERGEFKPISNELKKIADRLGLGTQQDMQQYPESMVEQAKKDMKY
jgi:hypothetical protein